MLRAGEPAAEFSGTTSEGRPIDLKEFRGRPLVLYFYPKANSMGCTVEARAFTEHYEEFRARGVAVVGVSIDSLDAQRRFSDACHVPYPLVADASGVIARRFGVVGLLGMARRVTFLIDAEGRIAEVIDGVRPGPHVRRALERLGAAAAPAGAPTGESRS